MKKPLTEKKVPILVPIILGLIIVALLCLLAVRGPEVFSFSTEGNNYESTIGSIAFDKTTYSCEEGATFETMIRTSGTKKPASVESYGTTDPEIATIDNEVSIYVNCVDCRRVRVVCKKAGNVKLIAKSSTGATTTSALTVNQRPGKIYYEKTSYSCIEGETFETLIKATNGNHVESYKSSDSTVATVDGNTSKYVNCSDCRLVRVVCKKTGTASLQATASNGATTKSTVTVAKDKGKITFGKDSLTCNVGDRINMMITATGDGKTIPTVESYSSSDTNVVTLEKDTSMIPNCSNCRMVVVACLKKGTAKLTAKSSTGATTTINVTVKEQVGTIGYSSSSYTCNAGESFETMLTVKDASPGTTIKSYKSSDTTIATIDTKTEYQVNCVGCLRVRVVCKKKGTVKLTATSSTGATTTSTVTVSQDVGTISYEKSSYTCNAGDKIETLISAHSTDLTAKVSGFGSSNVEVATIATSTTRYPNCSNCKAVVITCKKAGSVNLTAKSSTGATTNASVTVAAAKGTISFESASYSCKAGKSIETLVTATNLSDPSVRVKSVTTSNVEIATVATSTTRYPNCSNCRAIKITCKKKGNVTLSATSTTGASGTAKVTVTN